MFFLHHCAYVCVEKQQCLMMDDGRLLLLYAYDNVEKQQCLMTDDGRLLLYFLG